MCDLRCTRILWLGTMVGVLSRPLSSLEHAWPLCDECVTAFQRPPRGDLWRLGESVLRSRVSYPPAPPKAPPRGCSRAVSCVGRPTHQDEPQAPWRACSGRYAAVGVWVARPTMGLSPRPPDRMPTVDLARAMARHRLTSVRAGYEPLHVTH